jgi:hypothetical protein
MNFLLQVDFPYSGPFGEAMYTAMQELAQDIAEESGLVWKMWTENETEGAAGGIYLFDNDADARRYLEKHTARLEAFGISGIHAKIFTTNDALSRITRAPL